MALWSRLKKWLSPEEPKEELVPISARIDDWNEIEGIGMVSCADTARLRFDRMACADFEPLIGLDVEVVGVGVPAASEPYQGMLATRMRLLPGSEAKYAALLRIREVERAAHGARAPGKGAPPWARQPGGKRPAGPPRAHDAFYALTILLSEELPQTTELLAEMLRSRFLPDPQVRIIPLVRNGKQEAGFSAEVRDAGRRAFLLYRPSSYEAGGPSEEGRGSAAHHVGLFVGGPHSPRVAALLGERATNAEAASSEIRMLSDLARSLLKRARGAEALVVNRAGKALKPRETALRQLGDEDAGSLPWLLWIDWNVVEEDGVRLHRTMGMESLGRPDVAVVLDADEDMDRSRSALLYVCQQLVAGQLDESASRVMVPRSLSLREGSLLLVEPDSAQDAYVIRERDHELILLQPV